MNAKSLGSKRPQLVKIGSSKVYSEHKKLEVQKIATTCENSNSKLKV
jgi:hypothetical protein